MSKQFRHRWLVVGLALLVGVTLSSCGKKKSGLLLLPDLVEGEGGPQVSPDNPKTAQEETTTQEAQPVIEVVDDTGSGSTGTNNGNDGKVSCLACDGTQNGNGNTGTNDNKGNTGNNGSGTTASDNTGNNGSGTTTSDNSGSVDEDDVAEDPQESEVVSDDSGSGSDDSQNVGSDNNSDSEEVGDREDEKEEESAREEDEKKEEDEGVKDDDEGSKVGDEEDKKDEDKKDEDEQKEDKDSKHCKVQVIGIDTSKGRWYNTRPALLPHPKKKNKVVKMKGVHTYWARQNLYVKVNNTCEEGKYRLEVVAKNIHGPLPDWYHYFVLRVYNKTTGESLGTMLIRAHDKKYHKGELAIRLPKGKSVLNIVWMNDAWKPKVYDANIQIKRIKIKKIKSHKHHAHKHDRLVRKGSQFCDTHGRWFVGTNPPSAYTYWARQTVSYCFNLKKAGKYKIVVKAGNAKRGLPLMSDYKAFRILVASDGKSNYITIPAKQGEYKKGSTVLDLPAGKVVLNITWLNDRYRPPKYDANIEIVKVKLKRVGDVESPISAYLLQNPNLTYKVVIPGIILVMGALGMIYWLRKERVA